MGISTNHVGGGHEWTDTYPQDELFAQLAHPMRRRILDRLTRVDYGERVDCTTLTKGDDIPERERIRLHHVHLPKLAYVGYVDWDPATETVARGGEFAAIEPALELLRHNVHCLPGSWS
ncbi:hypothetical protein [Halobaculum marinum]|uniref:Transcriptional regulator n=1 Tax=Halobaculum marinum TaxID=3031996 RepID=A0ABD5WYW0_9EURY|nr:hypothetical protein [Halobaculum sp. DT55]